MSRIGSALRSLRSEGVRSTAWRSAKYLSGRFDPFRASPLSTVYVDDVVAVDWTEPHDFNAAAIPRPADGYRVAWIISPPSASSGGHQNAFRFMRFLEQAGHRLTVYLFAPAPFPAHSVAEIREMMRATSAYPDLDADIRMYDPVTGLDGAYDAVFASDWENTYTAYRVGGAAKRFYFVQDFEPAFFPASTEYVLAENSYRLGFHGFTAGNWLAGKLGADYGMPCDSYEYAADSAFYHRTNTGHRSEIMFYARPPTPRRATEFGLLALLELHRRRPDVTIHLAGWDMSGYEVPFPYVNHAALDIGRLGELYNRCAAALVFSLTDMSLLPIEAMAAGTVPVVNDGPNTRGVLDSPFVEWVPMSPRAIADRLEHVLDRPDQVGNSAAMAASVAGSTWEGLGERFAAQFEAAMSGGA